MDGSRIDHEDAPELVELLWEFPVTEGDKSTYATLPNMNGRVFQGTTTVADVCKYLEESLPNITGDSDNGGESSLNYSPNGVFYSRMVAEGQAMSYRPENNTNIEVICLDASRVSNIYNGSKLQPSALQALPCIRF